MRAEVVNCRIYRNWTNSLRKVFAADDLVRSVILPQQENRSFTIPAEFGPFSDVRRRDCHRDLETQTPLKPTNSSRASAFVVGATPFRIR
jgi:hypothetical protein